MKVAIHQPQYMCYPGVIDKIDQADEFIFLDNVQFEKNEWQNRNRIKSHDGPQWLTVPVLIKGRSEQKISSVEIDPNVNWQRKHLNALKTNYIKASFYEQITDFALGSLYTFNWQLLASLNMAATETILEYMGVETKMHDASSFNIDNEHPDDRIINLVRKVGGDTYLAGVGGKDYMDLERYKVKGIHVEFQEFTCPEYPQLYEPFIPNLSVLDMLFNCGSKKTIELIREQRK